VPTRGGTPGGPSPASTQSGRDGGTGGWPTRLIPARTFTGRATRPSRRCRAAGEGTTRRDAFRRRRGGRCGVRRPTIEVLAWIAARQQKQRLAAPLLGAADTLRTEHDKPIASSQWTLPDHDACEQHAHKALGPAVFAEAFHDGRTRSDEHILRLALDERLDPAPPARNTSRTSTTLTRREHEVASLVAQGLSNKEIALRLVISQRTAQSHLEHILTKLGFANRAEVAAWIAAKQSGDDG
jgi:DNA-binding CsgD family transcriptional regulator